MKFRTLGKGDVRVSEVGFGAWGIGGKVPGARSYGETDDTVSRQALQTAFDEGINFFDVSPAYGNGHAEALLADVFSSRRDHVVFTTKAGYANFQAPQDFTPQAIAQSVDGSLARLKTDYVDLLMLHDPDPEQEGLDETFAELERLKAQGKIRMFGVSVRAPEDAAAFIARPGVEAIQANLNLLDQRIFDVGAYEAARVAGCSIVARTPLCFGFLSERLEGDLTFSQDDHRSRWPKEQITRWQEGRRMFEDALADEPPISKAALRFCLSFDAVAAIIPGIMTPDEARDNAEVSGMGPLSKDQLDAVKKIYCENEFFVKRRAD